MSKKKKDEEVKPVPTDAKVNPVKEPTQFRKVMGRKTGSGKAGVTVMTPVASEIADEQRKIKNRKLNGFITKVFPDE